MQCSSSRSVSKALLPVKHHDSSSPLHLPRSSPAVAGCPKRRVQDHNRHRLSAAEQPVIGLESSGTDNTALAPATPAEGEAGHIRVTGIDHLFTLKEFLMAAELHFKLNNLVNATGSLVSVVLNSVLSMAMLFWVSKQWSQQATSATLRYLGITGTPDTLLVKAAVAAVVWWANCRMMQSWIDDQRLQYSNAMTSMSKTPAQLSRLSKKHNYSYLAAAEAEEYIKSKWYSGWSTTQPTVAWIVFIVVQLIVAWVAYSLVAVGLAA